MVLSDLPNDLLEKIFSRVPLKLLKAVKLTCKNWNTLTKDESFTKKLFGKTVATKENEFLVVTMMNYKVYSISVNLHGIHKEDSYVKASTMHKAKLISLNDDEDYGVDNISNVFHCDGLLLCVTHDVNSRLVVCNPYCGQTRLIKPKEAYKLSYRYAIGYEKMKNNSL
ncbi:hypothetical protein CARUB_v10018829mg [Capsella rubella]|uniref:F-box domain-containing protein n=1 Tax=Capsella rubella TaxID=81985 RepID=R0FRZ0_9BRAS|nr:hypothetical protein CARUB_v10018829mg [Capsella rubella]